MAPTKASIAPTRGNTRSASTPPPRPERPPFELGEHAIAAGTLEHLELPVARLPTGTQLSLPVAVAHGIEPGPVVWVSSAIHGDELNGLAVIRSVLRQLNPRALRGTLIAVSVVNVFGIINASRYLPDRRDLNRSFPGSPRGPLAGQLAHLFIEQVARRSNVGIDLHTGSDGRTNLPQIRCDLEHPETRRLARAFGAPVILHASLRDGSLRAAGRELGVPVLLYEGGEAHRFDRAAIDVGARGVLRVFASLGMLEEALPDLHLEPVEAYKSSWIRARQAGFCDLQVELGQRIHKDQPVATIFDASGKREHRVKSKLEGIVIGRLQQALVHRGDALLNVAQIDGAYLPRTF
ncbi:MAG: succinylglutamate desuccinylase/aspartoacylase family protein [Polyangiaceae bacterium]